MPNTGKNKSELVPLTIIRTETALSRYPVHRLSRAGQITIEIRKKDETGATSLLWEVSHNNKYGQPGPLAYKLDTLVINRRIEEGGHPVPKVLKLGSLREICRELEMSEGENTKTVHRALLQNASTFISARITYRDITGGERTLEADFNRYTIIFNGENLPDGRRADCVYLLLNDVYMEVLNAAIFRPLDYDYLKELTPGAQRFYEIVSYQIYAALRHNLPRAKLTYSEYCTLSTQVRYFDYDRVKKQMYKVHMQHIRSEYLARADLEATTDEEGRTDWVMYYTPGPKARAEFQAFMQGRKCPKMQPQLFTDAEATVELGKTLASAEGPLDPKRADIKCTSSSEEKESLIEELVACDLNRDDAIRFVAERPEECRRQLAYLSFVTEFKSSRGAYLRSAIEKRFGPPKGYEAAQKDQSEQKEAEARVNLQTARQRHEATCRDAYLAYLASEVVAAQNLHAEAYEAFLKEDAIRRQGHLQRAKSKLGQKILEEFDQEEARLLRFAESFRQHPGRPVLDFWRWDKQLNPKPFAPSTPGE